MAGDSHNEITGGIFFSAVIQGRNITVQLPPQVTPALSGPPAGSPAFTGREGDLHAVLETLAPARKPPEQVTGGGAVRVVAVAGMAGVGKTELAVQAARAALGNGWFPGGALFVDLFGYDPARRLEPAQALDGMLRALGIAGENIPADAQDRARLYASVLAAYAEQGRPILVVIDNASSTEQARPLLPADGATGAIVTSRDTLGMLGARLLDLNVLTAGDAVELLHRALNVAHPGDARVTDNPDDATKIAELCGELPLALQIIAALLAEDQSRPLAAMAADLSSAVSRLEEMRYDYRAVRAAFDLSYQRLDPQHKLLFRLLPVNPGPDISTQSTAVLTGLEEPTARHGLETLARAHLVEHSSSYGRWRMHDLLRLYADEQGIAHAREDCRDRAFTQLLDYYFTTIRAADAYLGPAAASPVAGRFPDRKDALDWLDIEYPNLTAAAYAAADSGDHTAIARDLPLAMARFLSLQRHFNDWIALSESALAAARQLRDGHGEGAALNDLGNALREVRRFDEAITALRDTVKIFHDTGDRRDEGIALNNLGLALQGARWFEKAIAAHQEAAQTLHASADRHGEGQALSNLGMALVQVQQFGDALTALRDAAKIFHTDGDRYSEAIALNNLGLALRELGRFDDAITAHEHAAQIYHDTGDQHNEGTALGNLGSALLQVANAVGQEALQIFQGTGDRNRGSQSISSLEPALRQLGRFDDAITAHQHAAQACHDAGDRRGEAEALGNLWAALLRVVITVCHDAVQILHDTHDPTGEGQALGNLGNALLHAQQFDHAISAYEHAARIFHDTRDQHSEGLMLANLEAAQQAQRSAGRTS